MAPLYLSPQLTFNLASNGIRVHLSPALLQPIERVQPIPCRQVRARSRQPISGHRIRCGQVPRLGQNPHPFRQIDLRPVDLFKALGRNATALRVFAGAPRHPQLRADLLLDDPR